jgi:hypothetical protein
MRQDKKTECCGMESKLIMKVTMFYINLDLIEIEMNG